MTTEQTLLELDAATRALDRVRAAVVRSDTTAAIDHITAAEAQLQTSLEATTAALSELADAKAALHGDFYTAITDRDPRPKPPPLALGGAGFAFTDPTFGARLIRVTDEHTAEGASIRVASNSHISAWNCEGTLFYVLSEHGNMLFYRFTPQTETCERLAVNCGSYVEPAFSYVHPNHVFGVGGANHRTVFRYDVATHESLVLCDLDRRYPELALSGYCGSVLTTDEDVWCVVFGGAGQDDHRYLHHSTAGLLKVTERCGSKIHAASMDRPGRYVLIYATGQDISAGHAQVTIWDTVTNALTPVTHLSGGHDTVGYGTWINQDCCTATHWDAMQWQIRSLATPTVTKDLITPTLEPKEIYIAEHSSWRRNLPDNSVPFLSSTYRRHVEGQPDAPWRAWDDEIIAVSTDGLSTVYRFAHHQSVSEGDFWAQPIANLSPDGRWCIVTSNWGKTLHHARQDVFLVHLR